MQQIKSFLLQHGISWPGGNWNKALLKRLRELDITSELMFTLNQHVDEYEFLCSKIRETNAELRKIFSSERHSAAIEIFKSHPGVGNIVAWGEVLENIENAKTLTWKSTSTWKQTPTEEGKSTVVRYMVLEPNSMRVEWPDGKVRISDHREGKALILDPVNICRKNGYGHPKLDLKHRQEPKDVRRAKRQKKAALKKRKPAPVVVLSRIVTKQNSTSTPDYLVAGLHVVGE